MSDRLGEFGVEGSTFGFVMFLFHRDGISERELTDHMLVDKATTTRAITRLVSRGLVRKEIDQGDRRSHLIFLTDRSLDLHSEMMKVKMEWTETVMNDFTKAEREKLMEYLARMEKNMEESREGGQ